MVVLLLGFSLRLAALDAQSIWWDEGISLHLATSTVPELLADRVVNIHPPLYFLLLKGWLALTGVSAFSGRYLSVLASFLQMAAVWAVCRRWFGRERLAVWLALLLTAVSPLSVIYAQEIRVYAFLPLVYLALLAIAVKLAGTAVPTRNYWVGLGVVTWLGLHLHYIVAFAIAPVLVWLLWRLVRQRRWSAVQTLLLTQIGVALASLPWFVAVLLNWTAVQAEAGIGQYLADPVPLDFLLKQVWVFHQTGLTSALARPEVRWLAAAVWALLLPTLLWRLLQTRTRLLTGRLLLAWAVPLLAALLVWTVRSFSHPRYIIFAAVGLLPLLGYVLGARGNGNGRLLLGVVRIGLAGCVLALSTIGLWLYFFDPTVAKDDMNAVAAYLEDVAAPDDVIFVPVTDWTLPFTYTGEASIYMPDTLTHATLWADLAAWTAVSPVVFTVDYDNNLYDWQRVVPFALESVGTLSDIWEVDDLTVRRYQLDGPVQAPELKPIHGRLAPLSWRQPGWNPRQQVTVLCPWPYAGG